MITGISEGKTLVKHISCHFKCKFDGKNWSCTECQSEHKNWWSIVYSNKIILGILVYVLASVISKKHVLVWKVKVMYEIVNKLETVSTSIS